MPKFVQNCMPLLLLLRSVRFRARLGLTGSRFNLVAKRRAPMMLAAGGRGGGGHDFVFCLCSAQLIV